MVENRPLLNFVTHAVLLLGVALVALPIWITFVAATHDEVRMMQGPIPVLPGSYFWANLKQTFWGSGFGWYSDHAGLADAVQFSGDGADDCWR